MLNTVRQGRTVKNQAERKLQELMSARGFVTTKRGWPDFFCQNPKTGEICIVEVKPRTDRSLKPEQEIVMAFLKSMGVRVYRFNGDEEELSDILYARESIS